MKNSITTFTIAIAVLSLFLSGCIQDKCEQTLTYYTYQPVYKSYETIRAAVKSEAPRDLVTPGKMYFKDAFIFVSEVNEGIHIINNIDPSNPENVGFISVPGNHDISIKGNILYADSYVDLVAIDITDVNNIVEAGRTVNVFPYGWHHDGLWADPDSGIAVDFVETEIVETVDCGNNGGGIFALENTFTRDQAVFMGGFASNSTVALSAPGGSSGNAELSTGIGGSLARFTIVNDVLYVVTWTDIEVFDISNLTSPQSVREVPIGWDIETIFPNGNNLFIGSMSGMHVYSIENPTNPTFVTQVSHFRSCDPVVVEGDYAYVTLKSENNVNSRCQGFTNQLDVINISNLSQAFVEYTYTMTGPSGLGIRNGTLFICDGDAGLKVYDASDVSKINSNKIAEFGDIKVFDVIPLNNLLLAIGEDGLYQYDYSNLEDIKLLSFIEVKRQ